MSVSFSVTDLVAGQTLDRITPSLATEASRGDLENEQGAVIGGCRAAWFSVSTSAGDPSLPLTFARRGDTYRGRIEVRMLDRRSDQDACRGQSPAVRVAAGT